MCNVPESGVVGVVRDGNGRHGSRDCPGNIGEYITCPPGTAHTGYLDKVDKSQQQGSNTFS